MVHSATMSMTARFGTSMNAAEEMLRTLEGFQQSPARSALPPHALAIDFPQRSPLGARALKLTSAKSSETIGIMAEPEAVLSTVRDLQTRVPEKLNNVGIILVNYVLHDVPESGRSDFLRSLARSCPNAVTILADYTMRDLDPNDAEQLFTADLERNRLREKTRQVYLDEHLQFTYLELYELMRTQSPSVRGHRLPAGRALIAGATTTSFWTPDLDPDWHDETKNLTADVVMPSYPYSRGLEAIRSITT